MKRTFNKKEKWALYIIQKGKCAICGKELGHNWKWHGDHIKPFSKGGETDVINGQALCALCNEKKGAKYER